MSNEQQIKQDDAIFNAAMSVLGEWPATRECSMRARMTMAADMQDRIMDTVNAILSGKRRSEGGKLAAERRWAKQKAKAIHEAVVTAEVQGVPTATPTATEQAIKKRGRGRPRKNAVAADAAAIVELVAGVPMPTTPPAVALPPAPAVEPPPPPVSAAVPPLPPMPSAVPPTPSANPFGTVQ